MRINVIAKPKKKKEYVEQVSPTHYIIAVKEPAEKGRANQAITRALTEYFQIPAHEVHLVSGQTNKNKIFEVPDSLANFEPFLRQKSLF